MDQSGKLKIQDINATILNANLVGKKGKWWCEKELSLAMFIRIIKKIMCKPLEWEENPTEVFYFIPLHGLSTYCFLEWTINKSVPWSFSSSEVFISFFHLQVNLYIHFSYIQTPPNHQLQENYGLENHDHKTHTSNKISPNPWKTREETIWSQIVLDNWRFSGPCMHSPKTKNLLWPAEISAVYWYVRLIHSSLNNLFVTWVFTRSLTQ